MTDAISEALIKIIKTYSNNNDLTNGLYILLNSGILNKKETKLCKSILEKLELLNTFDLSKVTNEVDSTIDVDAFDGYELDEVMSYLENFINERKQSIFNNLRDKAYKNVLDKNFDKETIDFIYRSFPDTISIKEDTTLDDLYVIADTADGYSTGYHCFDYYLNGLEGGVITTIVGSEAPHKEILCLNIAYNILCSKKNILYFSIGTNKKDTYIKLLIRHSCSDSSFHKLENNTSYLSGNREYSKVYNNFQDNYADNVIVVDESDYYISTQYSLLKLLCAYDNKFKNVTGNGIDVIFIDDLSKMKLFDGKKYITNKNTVASEIFTMLKSQARNFLFSGRSIPIIVTYETNNYNPLNIGSSIPEVVSCLSDNVVLVANSDTDEPLSRMDIRVFKSINGKVMNSTKDICCDYKHWYVYDKDYDSFPDSKQALEDAIMQNSLLTTFLPSLEESIQQEVKDDLNAEDIKLEF